MPSRLAYRHFHEESNTAAVTLVALAEFGLASLDTEQRGQELVLHGLLQRGRFLEGRGLLLARALRHLFDAGVRFEILHDASRTAVLRERLVAASPGFDFQLLSDLGAPQHRPLSIDHHLAGGASVILVEARHAVGRLPIHLLLVRPGPDHFWVMNSDTGEDYSCSRGHFEAHLASPVHAGAAAFAGRQYLYTGLAVRLAVG